MKQIILDFWNFIKNPKDEQYVGGTKAYKWNVFFTLFIFNIFFSLFSIGLAYLIDNLYPLEHKFEDLDYNPIVTILLIGFLVPFIEEVIFRLVLRRKGIMKNIFSESSWNKYFFVLVYISTISFALIHITNYKFNSYFFLLLAPFLTISQFVSGFIMTYLRVRFNFWMGFAFHALWNFSAIIFTAQDSLAEVKEIQIKNDQFQLEIKKKSFFNSVDKEMIHTANTDTIYQLESKGFKLKNILNMMDSTAIKYEPVVEYIDIKFTSEKGILTDSLLYILEKEGYIEKQNAN